MKQVFVFFLSACILCSCKYRQSSEVGNANKSPDPDTAKTSFFVTVNGYDFTDTATQLFLTYSEKEIIRLKYKTNLPVNTCIVVQKGLRINRTSALTEHEYKADTITVTGNEFTVPFSPHFVGGYVNFSVWPEMQQRALAKEMTVRDAVRKELVYYTGYSIDYKRSTPAGGTTPLPDVPVKLVITNE